MILKENLVLFLGALTIVVILLVVGSGLYAPLVFASCATLFLIFKHLLGTDLRIRYLTIPSFFILVYIIVLSIPSLIQYFSIDHPIKNSYLLAIQSVLVTFPIGVGLAKLLSRLPPQATTQYVYSKLEKDPHNFNFLPVYTLLLLTTIPILLLYFIYAEYIPLIEIIKAYPTSIDPVLLRFSENELPKIVHFLFEMLRRFILPLCVVYSYFMSRFYTSWKWHFRILFIFTLLISALTLDRAPPFTLFTLIVLAHLLIKNKSVFQIANLKLISILLVALLLGGAISVVQYQSTDTSLAHTIQNSAYVLYARLLSSPSYMASLSFKSFNYETGLLHGHYTRLFSLLPGINYAESQGSDPPLSAAPVTFVGDLWRQWGWPAVIIGTIVLGFTYQLIQQNLFTKSTKSIPHLAVFSILLINSIWIVYGNIFGITTISILIFGVLFALATRQIPHLKKSPTITHSSHFQV